MLALISSNLRASLESSYKRKMKCNPFFSKHIRQGGVESETESDFKSLLH